MSTKLLKQSLSLFEDDASQMGLKLDSKKKTSKDPMKLISTKKKGVKKELERLKKQQQKNKQQKLKKPVTPKVSSWHSQDADYTEESVQTLQRLQKTKATDSGTATLILDHHQKNVARVRRKPDEKCAKRAKFDTKTAFTDTDFDKFMNEFDFK